jgi:hypothetical protein
MACSPLPDDALFDAMRQIYNLRNEYGPRPNNSKLDFWSQKGEGFRDEDPF